MEEKYKNLHSMPDAELNHLVAVEVLGWKKEINPRGINLSPGATETSETWTDGIRHYSNIPNFVAETQPCRAVFDKMNSKSPSVREEFINNMPSYVAGKLVVGQPIKFDWEIVPPKETCIAALIAIGIKS